jgi:hypothetical protein
MSDKEEVKVVELNGQPVTPEQLNEAKEQLKKNERIVEVADQPDKFRKVKRLQE